MRGLITHGRGKTQSGPTTAPSSHMGHSMAAVLADRTGYDNGNWASCRWRHHQCHTHRTEPTTVVKTAVRARRGLVKPTHQTQTPRPQDSWRPGCIPGVCQPCPCPSGQSMSRTTRPCLFQLSGSQRPPG